MGQILTQIIHLMFPALLISQSLRSPSRQKPQKLARKSLLFRKFPFSLANFDVCVLNLPLIFALQPKIDSIFPSYFNDEASSKAQNRKSSIF